MAKRRGHGEGGVYLRKDRRWEGRLDLGYSNGRRVRKSVFGETKREVQEKLARLRERRDKGLPLPSDQLTVGSLLEQWLAEKKRQVRPRTHEAYTILVRRHLDPAIGHRRLLKLGPEDVSAFIASKLSEGLSPTTVRSIQAALRNALNLALRWGLVARNVASLVDAPRVASREVEAFSPAEAAGLLAAVDSDRLAAIYQVALSVGLRRGEALGLHWDDVDLDRGTLSVRQSLQRVEGRLQLVEPKTQRSRRTIALPERIITALAAHRTRQLAERLRAGAGWRDSGLVFTTRLGGPIEPRNLTRHFHRVMERAGIQHRRFHDLRHTCASMLLAQGVQARDIMETLGHSRIGTTMDLYAHVQDEGRRAVAEKMDAALAALDRPPAPVREAT